MNENAFSFCACGRSETHLYSLHRDTTLVHHRDTKRKQQGEEQSCHVEVGHACKHFLSSQGVPHGHVRRECDKAHEGT